MTTIDIKLSLPDSVAKDAASYGLLTPQAMAALLGEAVRQRRVNRLFEAMEKLSAANIPPMTPEEIETEIKAARQEARRAAGS